MNEPVKISKSEVYRLVTEEGYKREDLADHFGIPIHQMRSAMEQMGYKSLRARKATTPAFEIVDDESTPFEEIPEGGYTKGTMQEEFEATNEENYQ